MLIMQQHFTQKKKKMDEEGQSRGTKASLEMSCRHVYLSVRC